MKRYALLLFAVLLAVPVFADWRDQVRTNLDAIELLISETRSLIPQGTTTTVTTTTTTIPPTGNPYTNTSTLISVRSDDHLEASQTIMDNILNARYWRMLWDIADQAHVKLVILRGAHPDGRIDIQYPSIDGKLDLPAMNRIRDAFLAICVPPLPAGQEWRDLLNESEIRVGSDVWAFTGNRHLQIDDATHHRYDDVLYPHFHVRLP